jgi:hypothetical protein
MNGNLFFPVLRCGERMPRSAYLNPNTSGNTTTTTHAHTA